MKIYFDVKNQIITRTDRNQVIANSADYLEAEITFSAEWATMEKTMTFKNGNLLYTYVLVNDKILEENHLNLGVGTWKVSIQGVNEDKKIVTNECNLAVNASGWIGSEALPPESIWNQLLVIIQSLHTEVASTAALRSAVQKYIEDNYDALVKEAVIVDDVRAALDDMAEDGTLSDLLAPLVAAGMPEVVADQISAVVATQIGGVVANQIGAVVASQITTPVNQAVKNYCDDNFSGWSGALDRGLAQPLMAAPADMVGAINSALTYNSDTDIVTSVTWEQGSITNITDYAGAGTNTSSTRIRTSFVKTMGNLKVSVGTGYTFIYAIFDSTNTLLSSSQAFSSDAINITGDIKTVRIVIAKSNSGNIVPSEIFTSGIVIRKDNELVTMSDVTNAMKSTNAQVEENKENIAHLIGLTYTDDATWYQGAYKYPNNINDTPSGNATRICVSLKLDPSRINVIHIANASYQYTYGYFDANGNSLASTTTWQTQDLSINNSNAVTLHMTMRKSDDSNIAPSAYADQIIVYYDGDMEALIDATQQIKLKVMTFNLGRFSYGISPYYLDDDYAEKLANYKHFFASNVCDLLGLQEQSNYLDGVDSGSVVTNTELFAYLYPYNEDYDKQTCIKSKYPLTQKGTGNFSTGKPYTYATLNIGNKTIYLLDVHLTPGQDATAETKRQTEISEILTLLTGRTYFIMFGDFNAQSTTLFSSFTSEGYKIANGGYLPFEWTYSYNIADYSAQTPSDQIRYMDNVVTSANIVIDYAYRINTYADLSSDHLPIIAQLTVN